MAKGFFENKTRSKAILLLVSLIVGLGLSEGIIRIFYRPTLLDPGMLTQRDDELQPFGLKPNYQGYYAGGRVSIDGEGNRNVQPSCAGLKTALILGDSVVFGQGLDDNQTMASQLQVRLCGRYKVKNLAVPGFTTWNEYAAFRDYPHNVNELILIYVPNDLTFNNDHFDLRHRPLGELADDRIHGALRFLYSHVYLSFVVSSGFKKILNGGDQKWTEVERDEKALAYSMEAVEKLRDLCLQKKIRFSVGVYRDVWRYANPEASDHYEDMIKKSLNQRGIRGFVVKAHIEQLRLNEARVAWNDPHPSVRAIGLIVGDLEKVLKTTN